MGVADEIIDETATERLERRLTVLRQEYAMGEEQLRTLEERGRDLRQTMLRIQGAITVLEEMLQEQATRS